MATISPETDFSRAPAKPTAPVAGQATVRDPRLDVFRGIAMFIILVAHIPGNAWTGWIPARFGFSDATEIFVFCSGMASALAFGGAFARHGWWMGTARVAFRCWQVYWAHIALFFFVAMSMAWLNTFGFEKDYIAALNLTPFFDRTAEEIVGLFTLSYVPNYFDILPMYLVVLALMPFIMLAAGVSPWLAGALSVALWVGAQAQWLWLPAEPWSAREWFFNPFGWQLLFFTGFAFMRGWIPAPPVTAWLIALAAAYLILTAPIGSWKVFSWINDANPDLGAMIRPIWTKIRVFQETTEFNLRGKTDFGIFRYLHFLSLGYLAWAAAGEGGARLKKRAVAPGWSGILTLITKVGQQSLAVFVFSMALARILGFVLDQIGRNAASFALVNLTGFALIILCAYTASWFKSQPWRAKK